MQSHIDEIRALDADVVAVSVDPPERSREISEAYSLDYVLLSDPGFELIDGLGLRHEAGGMEGDVARPATFVLDREGRIVWRSLTDNWRVRPRPAELLDRLRAIP